jgi:hypothetical protein
LIYEKQAGLRPTIYPASTGAACCNIKAAFRYNHYPPRRQPASGNPKKHGKAIAIDAAMLFNLYEKMSKYNGKTNSIAWHGVFSNYMSCHRMAAWNNTTCIPNENIDPANPVLFSTNTKTDFFMANPGTDRIKAGLPDTNTRQAYC